MANVSAQTLGLLLPQVPRENTLVRQGPSNFTDRLQLYIEKKLFPDSLAVRGNIVAIDYVTQALLRHGTMEKYEIFVSPGLEESAREWLQLELKKHAPERQAQIHSLLDVLHGVDQYSLTAFFNPLGGLSLPPLIRKNFGSRLFPTTFLAHGFSVHSMLYEAFLRFLFMGAFACDSIICTSRACRDAMANILEQVSEQFRREFQSSIPYRGRLDTIPLCVDTEIFKPQDKKLLRRRLRLPKNALILLYIGFISPLKADLLPALQVFRELVKANPKRDLLFLVAGTRDALYAAALQRYAQDFSLSKHVRFMEEVPDKVKYGLIAAADVFVSPGDSIQESFGLTPVEAMSCGIPQVVADWNGYRDTVSHGETGFLVPTYWNKCDADLMNTGPLLGWEYDHLAIGQSIALDFASFRDYLQLLIDNDQLREQMSLRSRQRAEALYSFPAVVRQYEELWAELSSIAQGLTPTKTGVSFSTARYFECFKNHAKFVIHDDSVLSLTPLGDAVSDADFEHLLHPKAVLFRTIDLELARCAIQELQNPSTFGELIGRLAQDGVAHHPDYIRRNVMWLIKNGFVRPEIKTNLEIRGEEPNLGADFRRLAEQPKPNL